MTRRCPAFVWLIAATVAIGCGGPTVETDPEVITAPPPMDASAPAGTPRYRLEDAAAQGLVEYEVSGLDASSGESLLLTIQRLAAEPLDVFVVPGTVFVPQNPDAQRMVAWNVVRGAVLSDGLDPDTLPMVTSMYLPDPGLRAYLVEAYCLDFDLDNPLPADVFRPVVVSAQPAATRAATDVRAAQLIRAAKDADLSVRSIQVAIWADRDSRTKEEIAEKFTAEDAEMDAAFRLVLNTPPPARARP